MKSEGYGSAFKSLELYQAWRRNRANEILDRVEETYPVQGKTILDYGCGFGSLSEKLLERGADVYPVEIDPKRAKIAHENLRGRAQTVMIGEGLPFARESFDAVISMDVIEHVYPVESLSEYLSEAFRVLKPDGVFYAEMTPYNSVTGHHLLQVTHLPLHMLLPQSWIKQIIFNSNQQSFKTTDEIWQQFITLNKVSVPAVQALLKDQKVEYEGFILKFPGLFRLNIPLLGKLGKLGEALTLSYETMVRKA